jgi:hypothetical protein
MQRNFFRKLLICIKADSLVSKSQYERQFKKWHFRKNLKNAEWNAVNVHLSKRKRDGKESDLYVDGILVPRKKVQKETSRNCFVSLAKQHVQGNLPQGLHPGTSLSAGFQF